MQVRFEQQYLQPVIGNLRYGTVVTGLKDHPTSCYIKVNKTDLGKGIKLDIPRYYSALLNLQTGMLRAVQGDTKVIVCDATAQLNQTSNIDPYLKGYIDNA